MKLVALGNRLERYDIWMLFWNYSSCLKLSGIRPSLRVNYFSHDGVSTRPGSSLKTNFADDCPGGGAFSTFESTHISNTEV